MLNKLMKTMFVVVASTFAVASIADSSESTQLAQISDGFDAQAKYMASCFACHSTGAAGAPKVGADFASDWNARLEKGMDTVVQNAINGVNTMPPKGLCFDCTDDELRAIVQYMVDSST